MISAGQIWTHIRSNENVIIFCKTETEISNTHLTYTLSARDAIAKESILIYMGILPDGFKFWAYSKGSQKILKPYIVYVSPSTGKYKCCTEDIFLTRFKQRFQEDSNFQPNG